MELARIYQEVWNDGRHGCCGSEEAASRSSKIFANVQFQREVAYYYLILISEWIWVGFLVFASAMVFLHFLPNFWQAYFNTIFQSDILWIKWANFSTRRKDVKSQNDVKIIMLLNKIRFLHTFDIVSPTFWWVQKKFPINFVKFVMDVELDGPRNCKVWTTSVFFRQFARSF